MKFILCAFALFSLSVGAQDNHGTIKIYDAKGLIGPISPVTKLGKLIMEDGRTLRNNTPSNAIVLNSNLEKVRDFYLENHNWNSWDGKGSPIIATINIGKLAIVDLFGMGQNAAWIGDLSEAGDAGKGIQGHRFIFGVGKKDGLDNFEKALDVIGHEFTHAVVEATSKLEYKWQSGALNEHLADVFGVIIEQQYAPSANPFLIGESVLYGPYARKAEAIRDLMHPEKGLSEQPGHMDDLKKEKFSKFAEGCKPTRNNDNCGVHILSGIPNHMSALVMEKLRWEDSSKLFYNVMTKRLKKDSLFKDYAVALREECKAHSADTCVVVDEALKAVGL